MAPPQPRSSARPAGSQLPASFVAALGVIGAFAAMLIWDQSTWWGSKDEYMFGYLVPLFVAYIVYDRWAKIRAALTSDPAEAPAGLRLLARGVASLGLLAGLAMFALGAFYRAGAGASQPGSLAMAMGFGAITLCLLYLASGDGADRSGGGQAEATLQITGPRTTGQLDCLLTSAAADRSTVDGGPSGGGEGGTQPSQSPISTHQSPLPARVASPPLSVLLAEPRMRVAALFLFPALVWMVSAPLVSAVENSLSTFLLNKVTVVVFFTFDALGYPIERQGSVLLLPLGQVGVAEACSGIRSLTGSIFSGCFLAAAFLPGMTRKVGLVFAAVVLAFLMNIVRSLTLTGIAYMKGPEAIEGAIHDITGFAVLGFTFLGLLALLPLFSTRKEAAESAAQPPR